MTPQGDTHNACGNLVAAKGIPMAKKRTAATQVHRIVLSLRVVTKRTDNKKFPTAYRVEDANGFPLSACSGLFGWGWRFGVSGKSVER